MRSEVAPAPAGALERAGELVATIRPLDPSEPCDLVTVAGGDGFLLEQEGHGLAGRGEALRIDLPDGLAGDVSVVAAVLDRIGVRREGGAADGAGGPGTGAVALGALPFDRSAPASLIVPEHLVTRGADGRRWVTTITRGNGPRAGGRPSGATTGAAAGSSGPHPALPDGFSLTSPRPHPEWEATIAAAIDTIRSGALSKVVVAREVLVEANRPIVIPDVLERLRSLYPACLVFCVDGFLGASPELLVERRGAAVRSHPLAGTFPRSGDPHADELLAAELVASVKDQREHRFVIDEIRAVLGTRCSSLQVPAEPSVMQLRNVLHLGTDIRGVLGATADGAAPTALELVAALHPTPAVAGTPTAAALAWLDEHEGLVRDRYAGPVGWVDARGDGTFSVAIRSAEVTGTTARLFAGVGVVEGSDPRRELVETQLKLQAILAAVVRP